MKPRLLALIAAICLTTPIAAQEVARAGRSIMEVATQLKNGEYVWAPELSASGPALLIVNLETQRAVLFRNGIPIAASTVSSGKAGHETPTGVFTILQKRKEHYSSTYNNAAMPNMQRLTWKGIALHAGNLPGYPASHGCIRLPAKFSALLFGATELGMTVVITSIPAVPSQSEAPAVATMAVSTPDLAIASASYQWNPERSLHGIVSVVISIADGRAVVLRGGVEIGSAPVRVSGETRPMAYVLRAWDSSGQHWLKLQFAGASAGTGMDVTAGEGKRFAAPVKFRHDVGSVLRPGSVVIVTPDSLRSGSMGSSATVIEEEPAQ